MIKTSKVMLQHLVTEKGTDLEGLKERLLKHRADIKSGQAEGSIKAINFLLDKFKGISIIDEDLHDIKTLGVTEENNPLK